MKLIIAIIRPEKLDDVRNALVEKGIPGMTLSRVSGHGRTAHRRGLYRGQEVDIPLAAKIRIEIAVTNDQKDEIIEVIWKAAQSGGDRTGDGKIFVVPVEESVRISSGERGEDAV
jgi:nitrogen regulatory protein PII